MMTKVIELNRVTGIMEERFVEEKISQPSWRPRFATRPEENTPEIVGTYAPLMQRTASEIDYIARSLSTPFPRSVRAVVLGGGRSVWDDCEKLLGLVGGEWDGAVIAINDIGCHYPGIIHYWATLHPNRLTKNSCSTRKGWINIRDAQGYPNSYIVWGHANHPGVDHIVHCWGQGSSGMLAVCGAYQAGYRKIVLCGVPMEAVEHFQESKEHSRAKKWDQVTSYRSAWEVHQQRLLRRTRSMSGWTERLLGTPTREWLLS